MSGIYKTLAAPNASTGNNTHTSVSVNPTGGKICVALVIEAVGATPTVTAKIQGTLDPNDVNDASAGWFDLPFITDTNDTVAATITKTATGTYPLWLSLSQIRFIRRVRVVTSANTNVTYHADFHQTFVN